jgi:hypothetical protein
MRLPGYNADASLSMMSNNYWIFYDYDNLTGHEKILSQARSLGFECDEGVCKCKGAFDCFRLGQSGHCGILTVCIGETCYCDWTRG